VQQPLAVDKLTSIYRFVLTRWIVAAERAGQHSLRINDQYRLCFRWQGEDAHEVEIVDYHFSFSPLPASREEP
jgi:hypothetical protein